VRLPASLRSHSLSGASILRTMKHPLIGAFIQGAARLLDIGGALTMHGSRDPNTAAARALRNAWQTVDSTLQDEIRAAASQQTVGRVRPIEDVNTAPSIPGGGRYNAISPHLRRPAQPNQTPQRTRPRMTRMGTRLQRSSSKLHPHAEQRQQVQYRIRLRLIMKLVAQQKSSSKLHTPAQHDPTRQDGWDH
jgi:hypothetical protein